MFSERIDMRIAEQLRYLILAAQREGNRALAAELAPLGLTPAQSEALRILAENGPMSLRAMGEMLVCDSGASPSRLVERLVSAGLVERAIDAGDRRQVLLSLTREGTDRARDVLEIEERLYDLIDAALQSAGSDTAPDAGARTDAILSFLRSFPRGSSAGTAYARRFASRSGR
jgi:DNA-binding MarR family transcriptional regulator